MSKNTEASLKGLPLAKSETTKASKEIKIMIVMDKIGTHESILI